MIFLRENDFYKMIFKYLKKNSHNRINFYDDYFEWRERFKFSIQWHETSNVKFGERAFTWSVRKPLKFKYQIVNGGVEIEIL